MEPNKIFKSYSNDFYYSDDPIKAFSDTVKKMEREVNKKQRLLEELIVKDSEQNEKIVLIGKGKQTKIINYTTKKTLKYREELIEIKNKVEEALLNAPEKNHEKMSAGY